MLMTNQLFKRHLEYLACASCMPLPTTFVAVWRLNSLTFFSDLYWWLREAWLLLLWVFSPLLVRKMCSDDFTPVHNIKIPFHFCLKEKLPHGLAVSTLYSIHPMPRITFPLSHPSLSISLLLGALSISICNFWSFSSLLASTTASLSWQMPTSSSFYMESLRSTLPYVSTLHFIFKFILFNI